jgi:hypothetical protein
MTMRRWIVVALVGLIATAAVAVIGHVGFGSHSPTHHTVVAKRRAVKTTVTATPVASTNACDNPQAVSNLLLAQGFKAGQFTVGLKSFNLSLPAAEAAATGKFASRPLNTKAELISFLKSGSASANALLVQVMTQSGASRAQAMDPSNWTGFQIVVPSNWDGNTSFVNGHVVSAGTRKDPAGDIGWVLINPSACQQVLTSSTSTSATPAVGLARGGCGNHELVLPVPPSAPKPVPMAQPVRTITATVPTTTTPPSCQATSSCGTTTTTTTPPSCQATSSCGTTTTTTTCLCHNPVVPTAPLPVDSPTPTAPVTAPPNTDPHPDDNVTTDQPAPSPASLGTSSGSGSTGDGTTGVPVGTVTSTSTGTTTTGSDPGTGSPTGSSAASSTAPDPAPTNTGAPATAPG